MKCKIGSQGVFPLVHIKKSRQVRGLLVKNKPYMPTQFNQAKIIENPCVGGHVAWQKRDQKKNLWYNMTKVVLFVVKIHSKHMNNNKW